jgi:hypothetical protein
MSFCMITRILKYIQSDLTLFSTCKPGSPKGSSPQQNPWLHSCSSHTEAPYVSALCFLGPALSWPTSGMSHGLPPEQLFLGWQNCLVGDFLPSTPPAMLPIFFFIPLYFFERVFRRPPKNCFRGLYPHLLLHKFPRWKVSRFFWMWVFGPIYFL